MEDNIPGANFLKLLFTHKSDYRIIENPWILLKKKKKIERTLKFLNILTKKKKVHKNTNTHTFFFKSTILYTTSSLVKA